MRLLIAVVGMMVLTLAPTAYRLALGRTEPADFAKIARRLDQVSLCPENWQMQDAIYEFGDPWRERLGLYDHRTVVLTTPEGNQLTVLLMLSETGEQLYHTPEICYAAHGCEIRGDVETLNLSGDTAGMVRLVQVMFREFAGELSRTAAYAYWVSPNWTSPPQNSIRSQMGREPFLLKIQLLLENAEPNDEQTQKIIKDYLEFLANQLNEAGIA
jgi:hypothetical protein